MAPKTVLTKKEAELAKKKEAVASATSGKAQTPMDKATEILASARPLARQAHAAFQQNAPKVKALHEQHSKSLPSMELLIAIAMLFFGIHFSLCVFSYRAFQLCGRPVLAAGQELKAAYRTSMEALRKESDVAPEGELSLLGLWQAVLALVVSESSEEEKRKAALQAMLKCVHIEKFVEFSFCLWVALTSVLATFWSGAVRAVVIGTQVQGAITAFIKARVPDLDDAAGAWVGLGLRFAGLFVGVVAAYFLQTLMLAVTSALEGSRVVTERLLGLLEAKGTLTKDKIDDLGGNAVLGVAAFGVVAQLFIFEGVPWYVSLPFIPGLCAESLLGLFA